MARANLLLRVVAATFLATLLSGTWSLAQSTAPVTEWVRGNAICPTLQRRGMASKTCGR